MGIPGSPAGTRSVIMATAPRDRASAAWASPCVCKPGSAKNASPAATSRLSALTPETVRGGASLTDPASKSDRAKGNGFSSKASMKLGRDKVLVQHWIEIGADAKHRRDLGDDTAVSSPRSRPCLASAPISLQCWTRTLSRPNFIEAFDENPLPFALSDLLAGSVSEAPPLTVSGVNADSRLVAAGDAFFALPAGSAKNAS